MQEFLDNLSDQNNQHEINRDKDLYFAFKQAAGKGIVSHIISNLTRAKQSEHIA